MQPLMQAEIMKWRQEFPILSKKIHLGNCSQSPQAKRVRQAILSYLDNWRDVGMDWNEWMHQANRAKQAFAKLINADPDEIALSMSVSDATTAVLSSLPYQQDKNKIVTTMIEFPTIGQIALAHQPFDIEFVPDHSGITHLSDYKQLIDHRTKLVCATHVYYQNGFKQDIASLAHIAHQKGSWIYIDAYQSLGTEPVDVKSMDIDMLSSGALKYLLGIPGIAFLYIKREIAEQLQPKSTGWFGQKDPFAFKVDQLEYASGATRFDTGTPPVIAAYATAEAINIINEVGVKRINQRIMILKKHIYKRCYDLGLKILAPENPEMRGASTAIIVPDAHQIEMDLFKYNIIVSARGQVVRLAPHFFTLENEIDTALELLAQLL